jgi:hypothetical protein
MGYYVEGNRPFRTFTFGHYAEAIFIPAWCIYAQTMGWPTICPLTFPC